MPHRQVEIIGGGPAGLYAGRLLKLARPDWAVTVHERMRGSRETFGFGIVLTGSTMDNLIRADPASAADIRAASHAGHALRLQRAGERIGLHGPRNLAIARSTLLEVLERHARAAGVTIITGTQADSSSLDADVVIAADGVGSATREKLASELGAEVIPGRNRYLWCGAGFALDDAIFSPARTGDGLYVAHAYPYAADRSTFLIEADEATWQAAGLERGEAGAAPGDSDDHSLRYLQDTFAGDLAGHALLGNRSRWSRFRAVHLDRWSHRNTVLIGDAAHTAHYTLGSGTKLAMEDAIALVDALVAEAGVPAAFDRYEEVRRPAVDRFQRLAERSQRWWESFPHRAGQPLPTLAVGFLTRAGNIDLDRLATQGDQPLRDALSRFGRKPVNALPADITGWILHQPFGDLASRVADDPAALGRPVTAIDWADPDPWSPAADAVVGDIGGDSLTWLRGPDTTTAMDGRIDLAERIRLQRNAPVIVSLPAADGATAAAALASGRCDLVHFTG